MRKALILDGDTPIDAVVLDDAKGDEWLESHPEAVEVTGLNPMPGVGNGWRFVKGAWVAPPAPVVTPEDQATLDARASAITKLQALGLTLDEVQAAFGLTA